MAVDKGKEPANVVRIRDFGGQVSNADPHDLGKGGAVKQVNAACVRPGELSARPGLQRLTFEE